MISPNRETERTLAGVEDAETVGATTAGRWSELRFLVDAYEDAQARRVRHGEQLRSLLSGRVPGNMPPEPLADCDSELERIRGGLRSEAYPFLGALYHRAAQDEASAQGVFKSILTMHPAWPWLSGVKGMGTTLSARLLARLDLSRAPRPSSFWAYCGLDTVPGAAVQCDECRREFRVAAGRTPRSHRDQTSAAWCPGRLSAVPGTASFRVASPRSRLLQRPRYDPVAKKICYLIGVSFLRTRSPYSEVYHRRRAAMALTHADWPKQRAHLTALRVAVKLFLRDLWGTWRRADQS
jgi:hypothetical protein